MAVVPAVEIVEALDVAAVLGCPVLPGQVYFQGFITGDDGDYDSTGVYSTWEAASLELRKIALPIILTRGRAWRTAAWGWRDGMSVKEEAPICQKWIEEAHDEEVFQSYRDLGGYWTCKVVEKRVKGQAVPQKYIPLDNIVDLLS